MNVDLRSLIAKLNHESRSAVEGAAGLCLGRTHYDVEVEHFLFKLLDATDADVAFILRQYGVDRSRLSRDLSSGLDKLKTGNARTPSLSPTLVRALTEGWTLGSVNHGAGAIRTGHIVLALLTAEELRRMLNDISREFAKISTEELRKNFETIVGSSVEESGSLSGAPATGTADGPRPSGKTPNLDQYTVDLTARAKNGRLDPVLGRDFEIRQVVDILTRRRQTAADWDGFRRDIP
jgi:type VI secretion system protein VasG